MQVRHNEQWRQFLLVLNDMQREDDVDPDYVDPRPWGARERSVPRGPYQRSYYERRVRRASGAMPSADDEEEGEVEAYEVARILEKGEDEGGRVIYRVRWKGYRCGDTAPPCSACVLPCASPALPRSASSSSALTYTSPLG